MTKILNWVTTESDPRVEQQNVPSDLRDHAIPSGTFDPVYEAKAHVLNEAILEIGMGAYQWQLFIVVGFGWASDNLWPVVTSLIFTPIANEFSPSFPQFLSLSQSIGLLAGAIFWGFGTDIFGRQIAFNSTLGITAVFGILAAASPSFAVIGLFVAFLSFGVGGNLPVDSALFLEFIPGTHQYLLTVLSINWAIAQLLATMIAWPLLAGFTCQENVGWRYLLITMGGISLVGCFIRYQLFTIYESPKYLMGKGRDAEAVWVVHEVARRNGKVSTLSIGDLQACEHDNGTVITENFAILQRNLEKLDLNHVRALFATKKLALSSSLMMMVWALIGLAYPLYSAYLPYLQARRGVQFGDSSTNITYRNSSIIAAIGIPGTILGAFFIEVNQIGRKGTLALSTALTGVFLYLSTTAQSSNIFLGWNCGFSFFSNIMYAVLYAYTPEIFPTKDRGTGNALTASANRIFGVMAPIVAIMTNLETSLPVYISGALFIVAGLLVLFLPYETRGKTSL